MSLIKCNYKEIQNEEGISEQGISRIHLWRQILVCSGVWFAFFGYGLAIGSPTVLIPQLRSESNSTDTVSDSIASWISAGPNYGAFVAVILTTILSSFIGRKPIFNCTSAVTIAANLLFYFSSNTIHVLISQIMQGLNAACILTIDLMIIGEYTSSIYRGVFLTIKTAMMFWGIWVANAIGAFLPWRYIGILGLFCSGYTFMTSIFWPESPYWLAEKGRFEECTKSHKWLKGQNEKSLEELQLLLNLDNEVNERCLKKLYLVFRKILQKEFYKPTLIGVLIIFMYHATGKFVFSVYAIEILKKICNDKNTAYFAMLFLDGITVLGMYVGCILSKFVKRRTLFFTCSLIGSIFLFLISIYLYLIYLDVLDENKYVTILLMAIFSISVSMGPIVLSSSIIGEIAPLKLKSLSLFIIVFFNFAVMGNMVKIAPEMFAALKTHGAFLLYGILSSLTMYLLYKFLPETKDKTLHEIREIMINTK